MLLHLTELTSVLELGAFILTMLDVLELKVDWLSVAELHLSTVLVATQKMLVLGAKVEVSYNMKI